MMPILYFVNVIYLIFLSVYDFKTYDKPHGSIPAILTTGFIFLMFIFNPNPITFIAGIIMGMFFIDTNTFEGIPDWKVIVSSCLVFPNIYFVLIFGALVTAIGAGYKLVWKKRHPGIKEIPFIPAIAAAFILMGLLI